MVLMMKERNISIDMVRFICIMLIMLDGNSPIFNSADKQNQTSAEYAALA